MSLIDEALKRAREQAEREGAERRSAASRWVPAYPLARRRSRALVWAGLAAACLLLGVGAGLVASRFTGEGARQGGIELPDEGADAGTADSGVPIGAGAVVVEETTATTDAFGLPFPLPTTAPPGALEPEFVPEPVPEPVPPPAPEESVPEAAPVPPPAAEPPSEGPASHVRRVPVPGGGSLELGGIAFSTNPVALLNGRVVSVGEVVEGFTVIAIEPRRVQLRGHGTTIFLTLD